MDIIDEVVGELEDRYNKGKNDNMKKGDFVGKKGDRIEKEVTFLEMKTFQGKDYSGTPITKFIYRFRDNDNNLYVWFTASRKYLFSGEELNVRMTIKEYDTFKDEKQNIVSRVYIEDYKDEEEERKKKYLKEIK